MNIEALTQPLCQSLAAYGTLRRGWSDLAGEGGALDLDDASFKEIARPRNGVPTDPERQLVQALSTLRACEGDLRDAGERVESLRQPPLAGAEAMDKNEEFLKALSDEMSTVETVTHPVTKQPVSMYDLDLDALVESVPEGGGGRAVAACLAAMRGNMEKMMGLQHAKNQAQLVAVKENEFLLRGRLFVAKRKLLALEQHVREYEGFGLATVSRRTVELDTDASDEALGEFAEAQKRIKALEGEVGAAAASARDAQARLDKVTQGYRSKNLEALSLKQHLNAATERLSAVSTESQQNARERDALAGERAEAHTTLAAAFPNLAADSLVEDAAAAAAAVSQVRQCIQTLSADLVPTDAMLHDHALAAEAMQICKLALGHAGGGGGGAGVGDSRTTSPAEVVVVSRQGRRGGPAYHVMSPKSVA